MQKIHIQVNSDLQNLEHILKWYDQLQNLPIPNRIFQVFQVALAEGFTYSVLRAHRDLPSDTPIEIEVTVFTDRLEIKIWDYGSTLYLEEMRMMIIKEREQKEVFSNYCGWWLLPHIIDSFNYTRTSDGRNCLTIVKNFES